MIGSSVVDVENEDSCIDASNMIKNLDEITATYERSGLGGVVRKCGSKFEFVNEARDLLIREYRSKYLKSQASIAIYTINNDWTYSKAWECPLDFGTFSWDSYQASTYCIDNSAAAIIKANKSTQYEYSVSELKESGRLHYDGVKIRNEVTFELVGASVEGESYSTSTVYGSGYCIWIPPFSYIKGDTPVNKSFVYQDQKESLTALQNSGLEGFFGSGPNTNISSYFLECLEDCIVSLDFTNIKVWGRNEGMANPYLLNLIFQLYKIPVVGLPLMIANQAVELRGSEYDYYCGLKGDFHLLRGEKMQFVLRRLDLFSNIGIGTTTFNMSNDSGFVVWNETATPVDMDVITPKALLNRILESMGGTIEIRGEIEEAVNAAENKRLKNTLLVAAEAIRGMQEAKIYSSFNKFCDFMEAEFGYVYTIASCEPAEGDIPEEYLKDYLNFDGFVKPGEGDNPGLAPSDGTIVQVRYNETGNFGRTFLGYADGVYYFMWNGCEDYQNYGDGFTSTLKTDVVFRDRSTGTYYDVKNNGLIEHELDNINIKGYNAISRFGGISYDMPFDSGIYTNHVKVANIIYVALIGKFMYADEARCYSIFPGSTEYNGESFGPRKDVLFVDINDKEQYEEGQVYVPVNTDLVKYKGDVPVLTKKEEAALVTFKHRSEVFKNRVVKKIRLFTEPEYKIESSRIYSELQVGYEKQDYDNGNNGYDEFNFTNYYTSGVALREKTLALICPYRADCYGFEELAEKRGSETSSTDSDSHIFLVNVLSEKVGGKYIIDRTMKVAGAYTDTVFNAAYAPMFMVEANMGYIGMFTQRLTFASSDGNSSIAIGEKKMSSSIKIADRLFTSGNILIKTNDVDLPSDWEGIIQFEWDDYVFQGFLKSMDANFHRNEAFEYELIEKEQLCTQ